MTRLHLYHNNNNSNSSSNFFGGAHSNNNNNNNNHARNHGIPFPDELLKITISYLDRANRIRVRLVCRQFVAVADQFWRDAYFECWNMYHSVAEPKTDFEWKNIFIERCKLLKLELQKSTKKHQLLVRTKSLINTTTKQDTKKVNKNLDLGFAFIHARLYDQAIKHFKKVLRIDPTCARAYEGLARAYSNFNHVMLSQSYTSSQFNNNNNNHVNSNNNSSSSSNNNNNNSKHQQYEESAEPDSIVSHSLVLICSEEAIRLKPANPSELYYLRGKALMGLNRYAAAVSDFTRCLDYLTIAQVHHLGLEATKVYHARMVANLKLGNIKLAYEDCRKIQELGEDEFDSFIECGRILWKAEKYQESILFLQANPVKTRECCFMLWKAEFRCGNYATALSYLRNVDKTTIYDFIKKDTIFYMENKETLLEIGITYLVNREVGEALKSFGEYHKTLWNKRLQIVSLPCDDLLSHTRHLVTEAYHSHLSIYGIDVSNEEKKTITVEEAWSLYNLFAATFSIVCLTYAPPEKVDALLQLTTSANKSPASPSQAEAKPESTFDSALNNLNRAIAQHPSLLESYYQRALLLSIFSTKSSAEQRAEILHRALEDVNHFLDSIEKISSVSKAQKPQQQRIQLEDPSNNPVASPKNNNNNSSPTNNNRNSTKRKRSANSDREALEVDKRNREDTNNNNNDNDSDGTPETHASPSPSQSQSDDHHREYAVSREDIYKINSLRTINRIKAIINNQRKGLMLRAYILYRLGNMHRKQAIADCESVLELDPADDIAMGFKAVLCNDFELLMRAEMLRRGSHSSLDAECSRRASAEGAFTLVQSNHSRGSVHMDPLSVSIQLAVSKFRFERKLSSLIINRISLAHLMTLDQSQRPAAYSSSNNSLTELSSSYVGDNTDITTYSDVDDEEDAYTDDSFESRRPSLASFTSKELIWQPFI